MSRADERTRQLQQRLLRTYEHTGTRLLILGIGLLGVLGVAVVTPAVYALGHHNNPAMVGVVGSVSVAGLFFGLSATLKQVVRILEARNRNPAMVYYRAAAAERDPAGVPGARPSAMPRKPARKRNIKRRTAGPPGDA